MRFRTAFLSLSAFCLLTSALARNALAIPNNAGTKNAAFLKLPTDARGVALGDAIVSMAQGTEGMRWNPAALGSLENRELSATHVQYYQDVRLENIGFAFPFGDSALGANAFYLSPGSLEGRNTQGAASGDFQYYDLVGSLGFGKRLVSRSEGAEVLAGAALKVVQETIADTQQQNAALDAGLLFSPWQDLQGGLTLRNLSTGKANFPKEILGGVSYTFLKSVTAAMAVNYSDDAPIRLSGAVEYRMEEYNTALRAGYRTHDALDNSLDSQISFLRNASLAGLTAGAGFEYQFPALSALRFEIDYAIAPFGSLGIAHTVTVKTKW